MTIVDVIEKHNQNELRKLQLSFLFTRSLTNGSAHSSPKGENGPSDVGNEKIEEGLQTKSINKDEDDDKMEADTKEVSDLIPQHNEFPLSRALRPAPLRRPKVLQSPIYSGDFWSPKRPLPGPVPRQFLGKSPWNFKKFW